MAENKLGEGLKKILLAGIGAVAVTAEKSQVVLDDLVKKGEITVEQGKELNKELQRNIKSTFDKGGKDDVADQLAKMSADELAALKAKIAAVEEKIAEVVEPAEDVVTEEPAEKDEAEE